MGQFNHSTFLQENSFRFGQNKIRQTVYTDISPEIALEMMMRVAVSSRIVGKAPEQRPMSAKFRKRLANVRRK